MDHFRFVPVVVAVLAALLWAVPASATFPGENGKLVFDLSPRIFTVFADGSELTPITPETGFAAREPAFSPDGRQIAFDYNGGSTTGWGIWVMSNTGTDPHQITRDPSDVAFNDTYPAWSPDGEKIVFRRDRDLLVMNADGSGATTNLTENFLNVALDPEWSPLGDLIAFSDGGDVYVVRADGSADPQRLTLLTGNQNYPSWAPDGSAIAYSNLGTIGRVNPDGTNEATLATGLREVWEVAWSPDGNQIGFINDPGTNINVQEELWMMNADGTNVRSIGTDTSVSLDWGVFAAGPPPPVLGETANIREVKGKVFVGIPSTAAHASQKGVDFVPLEEARDIPIGSFLDTRKGTVALTTARNKAGKTQSGRFSAGLFQVLQSRARAAKGLTELRMKGSAAGFRRCRANNRSASAALSRRTIRRLRANARGRYRTRGRRSAATVRGTKWLMEDRCDGTLTKVQRGKVAVRDFRLKKTIVLTAGKSYLAQ